MLHPEPELHVYDRRADSLPERTVSLNPHANATKGSVNATVDPKLKPGPLDPGYGQANAELTASATTRELTVSLNPHENATKGSLDGAADPGYGQPSAGRTDAQREYEKEQAMVDPKLKLGPLDPGYGQANATIRKQDYESTTQKINSNIADRIQQAVDEQNNKIKEASTMTAIKSQSIKIRNKFRKARRLIKDKQKADKLAARKAKKAARKAKKAAEKKKEDEEDEDEEDEGKFKVHDDPFALSAEEGKLKQEEMRNGVDTDTPPGFADGKIDIAPSGNWVRPGRPAKKK